MVKQYLILFAHSLPSFRIEELTAVAQYHAIKIHYDAGNAVDLSASLHKLLDFHTAPG